MNSKLPLQNARKEFPMIDKSVRVPWKIDCKRFERSYKKWTHPILW
jgi:hypothetical protein